MKKSMFYIVLLLFSFDFVIAQHTTIDLIPTSSTPIFYIPINFNIFQNSTGTSNFPDNETTRTRLDSVVASMNQYLSTIPSPSDPIPGVPHIQDSRIRVVLKGIYFYKDETIEYSISDNILSSPQCINRVNEIDPQRMKQLNICITNYVNINGTAGFARGVGTGYGSSPYIVTYKKFNIPNYTNNGFAQHLLHELGHLLSLGHTYKTGNNGLGDEICDSSDPDFLDDVFQITNLANCPDANYTDGCDICYHDADCSCDPYSPYNTCTNNMMSGGSQNFGYLSPKQLGRMHKSLYFDNIAKYCYYENPAIVTLQNSEVWNTGMFLHSNIVIPNNVVIRDIGPLYMNDNCVITIESGGTLILENIGMTSIHNYSINIKAGGQLILKSTSKLSIHHPGTIHVECNGKICIEIGAKIYLPQLTDNIFLHSGYIIPSGYNTNIQPAVSTPTPLGSVVISSPSVLISGTQTVDKIYSGNTVSTSGATTIPNSRSIYVWGENKVNIYSGFQVQSGGYFEVNTINNSCQ